MTDKTRILAHAVSAGAFFFLFQHFGLSADLQTSCIWAIVAASAAAYLAYSQKDRGR